MCLILILSMFATDDHWLAAVTSVFVCCVLLKHRHAPPSVPSLLPGAVQREWAVPEGALHVSQWVEGLRV